MPLPLLTTLPIPPCEQRLIHRPNLLGYSYVDAAPALPLCGAAQQYLSSRNTARKAQVLAASLTSIEQVMQLARIQHITVSPPLLAELAATPAAGWPGAARIGEVVANTAAGMASGIAPPDLAVNADRGAELDALVRDEGRWRMAFARAAGGAAAAKVVQAINIFADMQERLEEIARRADGVLRVGSA